MLCKTKKTVRGIAFFFLVVLRDASTCNAISRVAREQLQRAFRVQFSKRAILSDEKALGATEDREIPELGAHQAQGWLDFFSCCCCSQTTLLLRPCRRPIATLCSFFANFLVSRQLSVHAPWRRNG